MATEPSDARDNPETAFKYLVAMRLLIRGVRIDQLVEGLNTFYGDYRNRGIAVAAATAVIIREIRGMPRAEVEAWIEDLRRGA